MDELVVDKDAALNPVDVLFINPGHRAAVYQNLGNSFSAIEPPVLAGLFATYVRNKGMTVDILDASVANLGPDDVAKLVTRHYKPVLVVVVVYGFQPSASTQNMPAAGEVCQAIKCLDANCKIMMTGTHPAALPQRTMQEEAVDFVCDREGPETIFETATQLKQQAYAGEGIASLWYRDAGEICSNPAAALMTDLDEEMPIPAWDLLPMQDYRAHNWHCFEHIHDRQPYASIYTSLGCPYKCSFCCINAPFGKPSYRMWSAETIIKQIDVLVNDYGVKNIKFSDEMFVLNRNHVIGLCDLLIERDYDLNIWAYARVDTVKDEFLEKLSKAGFRWLALGIESGSRHVRDGVEKGRFGVDEIIAVVRKIQAVGISVIGNYIFGLPDDTMETMEETLALALEAKCEFANFYSAMAYPGSKLYDQAIANDWPLPDSWLGYSQHSYDCLPLPTQTLSAAEVLRFRDQAFVKYYSDANYLAYVEKKFGHDVLTHIAEMNKISLERKIY